MSIGRALITGAGGQLGNDLRLLLEPDDRVSALGHDDLDIIDDAAVGRVFDEARPDVVFNCAAFHNVEECEHEEDQAAAVNVRAVKRLSERCAERGAKLVHFSTNYVFDGDATEPYREGDPPNPRSVYAITKLAGEYAALAYSPALVIRSAGLYGLRGSASKGGNFVERMLARAASGEPIRMVADQRLSPTFTADLAAAVIAAVERGAEGVMHLTSGGACSWHEFTAAILELAEIDADVEAVETIRPPGGADRPLNGVLACSTAAAEGLAPLRGWREALADYLSRRPGVG